MAPRSDPAPPSDPAARDFGAVVARLRDILLPYGDRYAITRDGPAWMTLEVHGREGRPSGYFAPIRVGKR